VRALAQTNVNYASFDTVFEAGKERWYRFTIPGTEAVATWTQLRQQTPTTGYWPLLVGDSPAVERLALRRRESRESATKLLRQAAELDVEAWLNERQRTLIAVLRENVEAERQYLREHPDADDSYGRAVRPLLK